jgi:hypothetical protein
MVFSSSTVHTLALAGPLTVFEQTSDARKPPLATAA